MKTKKETKKELDSLLSDIASNYIVADMEKKCYSNAEAHDDNMILLKTYLESSEQEIFNAGWNSAMDIVNEISGRNSDNAWNNFKTKQQ